MPSSVRANPLSFGVHNFDPLEPGDLGQIWKPIDTPCATPSWRRTGLRIFGASLSRPNYSGGAGTPFACAVTGPLR